MKLNNITSFLDNDEIDAEVLSELATELVKKVEFLKDVDLDPAVASVRSILASLKPITALAGEGIKLTHDFKAKEVRRLMQNYSLSEAAAVTLVQGTFNAMKESMQRTNKSS